MKRIFLILTASLLLIPGGFAQRIGDLVEDTDKIEFPDNSMGFDIMFGEGGMGLGFFYRTELSNTFQIFGDLSFSESEDKSEIEYIDIFGQPYTPGKVNRVFIIPVSVGLHYRLFQDALTANLRPYINAGAGPTMIMTTPYAQEYFKAFGDAEVQFTAGGYFGFGANFGVSEGNLLGLNLRYYIIKIFEGEGVESLEGQHMKNLGGFYLTINMGWMY